MRASISGLATTPVDVEKLIDNAPASRGQIGVFALCALIAMADGFDLQIAGSLAPVLSDVLQLRPSAFGPVFAAGFGGILTGSLLLGEVADRTGRKMMVVASLAIAGAFTLALPVLAGAGGLSLNSLIACRFLAGIGIGGVMPNVLALTAEYAPRRSRAFILNTMYCGVPLGSVTVGLTAAVVAPVSGWQAVFYLGGGATLLLAVLSALALPESVRFLVVQGAAHARVEELLRRVLGAASLGSSGQGGFILTEAPRGRPSLRQILGEGRAVPTLLLWLALFLNLLMIVFVLSWLPIVMRSAGLAMQVGVLLAALFSLGGMAGSVLVGRAIDRFGSVPVLVASYLVAAAAVACCGFAGNPPWTLYFVTIVAGAAVIGAQAGLTAMAADLYPTAMRTTGLGWALGVGRIGSIAGPALGGVALSYGWSTAGIFAAAALPAVAAAGVIAALGITAPALAGRRRERV